MMNNKTCKYTEANDVTRTAVDKCRAIARNFIGGLQHGGGVDKRVAKGHKRGQRPGADIWKIFGIFSLK